jgi:two-component system phosphate regulon sensor histidine kinase PhoR
VIVNILENAIKYSPNVPEIEILPRIKDMIIIKVKDSGLGMSKIAQKNFEILQRAWRYS